MKRYSSLALPSYAFIPGQSKHPLKDGGHMENEGEPESYPLSEENYKEHEHYLYALDLYNYGFYWEAHVYLEAIWNANNRTGDIAELMKAIIKICAAKIKEQMKQERPAQDHYNRAKELINSVSKDKIIGLRKKDLLTLPKEIQLF